MIDARGNEAPEFIDFSQLAISLKGIASINKHTANRIGDFWKVARDEGPLGFLVERKTQLLLHLTSKPVGVDMSLDGLVDLFHYVGCRS